MKVGNILKIQGSYNFIDYWLKIKKKYNMTLKCFTHSLSFFFFFAYFSWIVSCDKILSTTNPNILSKTGLYSILDVVWW